MRRLLVVVLVAAVATAPAVAAPPALKPLAQQIVSAGAPGAVVYVREPGGVRAKAAGQADRKKKTALTPAMSFRVGSITKSFVAVVVLQLAAEGKLTLDDTVERWLPGVLPNGTAITLRHLLNHTSGVPNYTENDMFLAALLVNRKRVWTPLELLGYAARPAVFAPGADWEYSNTNYVLLGLIVEAATGRSLGDELRERIFEPLSLSHTTFPVGLAMPAPYAHGYLSPSDQLLRGTGKWLDVTAWHPSWAWAAGALVSTADDLARFYSIVLGGRLLAFPQLSEMRRTVDTGNGDAYGLGIIKQRWSCGEVWGHTGGVPGYTSLAFASPDGSRAVVVLVNESVSARREGLAIDRALTTAFCKR
jgi:D-alanyl-D-alanine carboxypeptidase